MSAKEYFESSRDIQECIGAIAEDFALTAVERKRGLWRGTYSQPLGLEGSVEGMMLGATIAQEFALGGATALVMIDLVLDPPLWGDLQVNGRMVPLAVPDDFLCEFDLQTPDERFANALLDDGLKRLLLDANQGGFVPTLTESRLSIQSPGLGSCREVRSAFRFATQIAERVRERRGLIPPSKVQSRLTDAWATAATHFGAKFDEERLSIELGLSYGTLRLRTLHSGYQNWRTELAVELDPPLPGQLKVTTFGGTWERWFAPDIKFGDSEFDDRYLVRASSRELAERVLTVDARKALRAMNEHLPELLVTEQGMVASRVGVLDTLGGTKDAVGAALATADELLRQRQGQQAYR
ncbi:MAG: hypothetical protein R3B13_07550 [Polyangiaceae bacterium]